MRNRITVRGERGETMMPRRITVLGAGGFVGSHLVPALLARFDCAIDAVDVDFGKLKDIVIRFTYTYGNPPEFPNF